MPLKFAFNEAKALETLAFIAKIKAGFTPFYVAKVLFFAEKWHLNRYGRPIIADTYIAMPRGPVPSTIKNYMDGEWGWSPEPDGLDEAVKIDHSGRFPRLMPIEGRQEGGLLSSSDAECLKEAIDYCKDKSPDELSKITHFEKAWKAAEANRPMDYADFIDDDNPHKKEILRLAQENAAYAIL
ncbi:MAG TPA: Panacea domain-containing protein [Pseudolabrys sp.]|uniref:Panacea domain-containing protein n=1 Tax=Pseudolabrys sp. TaxID=1960880 RepID=UPI002DDD479B|nr:Panacea domain-containing protein [Pseudolabrys sp.]HEV2628044.1 Panacea domain-containing protein [Pseudolabrys sp.]